MTCTWCHQPPEFCICDIGPDLGLTTTYHVGLPIAAAGTIKVGNIIHVDRQSFTVTKVGGAAFDMIPTDGYPSVTDDTAP